MINLIFNKSNYCIFFHAFVCSVNENSRVLHIAGQEKYVYILLYNTSWSVANAGVLRANGRRSMECREGGAGAAFKVRDRFPANRQPSAGEHL